MVLHYDWLWAADVGDPGYQDRWTKRVLDEAPWDGVFVDDVNSTLRHHTAVEDVARYPTDSAHAAATSSALETIGPRIRSAGRLVVANVCCEDASPGNWARSLRFTSPAR